MAAAATVAAASAHRACWDAGSNYTVVPPRPRHLGSGGELRAGFLVLSTAGRTSCHAPPSGPTAGRRFARWVRFTQEGAPEAVD